MPRMSDEDLLRIAQTAVPEHLKTLGRIVVRHDPPPGYALTSPKSAAQDDLASAIAKEVGTSLGEPASNSADVEFVEHTALGSRSTVVNIRDGKIAHVLKRA
jgi:hypothetical protein